MASSSTGVGESKRFAAGLRGSSKTHLSERRLPLRNLLDGFSQAVEIMVDQNLGIRSKQQEGFGTLSWTHDLLFPCPYTNWDSVSCSSKWLNGRSMQTECNSRSRKCLVGTSVGTRLVASSSGAPQIEGAQHRGFRFRKAASQGVEKVEMQPESSTVHERPSVAEVLTHPLLVVCWARKDVLLFAAGAFAGAVAKTLTAPLDRVKILMQIDGAEVTKMGSRRSLQFFEAVMKVGTEEGLQGYWKGNVPQVIRIVPYSAVQLFSYEVYKKLFKREKTELSVLGRLSAGACAGMTSTLVTYPLDTLRFRMAVDSGSKTMGQVALAMLKDEGLSSFYRGLGPSLLGIAPYIALNFCIFDLIKKSLPADFGKTPAASFFTAFVSATMATTICYPLDTVRRQMQLKGSPFTSVLDAIPGIISRDGVAGLYRGFVPNALKNLPNSSIRLTTFDATKNLITASQVEFEKLLNSRTKSNCSSQNPQNAGGGGGDGRHC